MTHTDGPWQYDGADGYGDLAGHRIRATSAPEYILAVTIADVAQLVDESEANARLIAASPTLLEVAQQAAKWFRDYERQHRAKLTAEGNLKADTNAERAAFIEAAIASATEPQP